MAGYNIITFTSTETGDTKENCIEKRNELMKNIANFIAGLIGGFVVTEYDYDTSTGAKSYEIGRSDGKVKWLIRPHSYAHQFEFYLKYDGVSTQGSNTYRIQNSEAAAGYASINIAYKIGLNGDLFVWIVDIMSDISSISAFPSLLYLNTTECGGNNTAKFMLLTVNNVFVASTDDDSIYLRNNRFEVSGENMFKLTGSNYDMTFPFIIGGTKYIADNIFLFTNSNGMSTVTAITDENKRYLFSSYGSRTFPSLLMQIEPAIKTRLGDEISEINFACYKLQNNGHSEQLYYKIVPYSGVVLKDGTRVNFTNTFIVGDGSEQLNSAFFGFNPEVLVNKPINSNTLNNVLVAGVGLDDSYIKFDLATLNFEEEETTEYAYSAVAFGTLVNT